MKRPVPLLVLFLPAFLLLASCHPYFRPTALQYGGYNVQKLTADSAIQVFLDPYARQVSATMDDVLAQLGNTLQKQLPDGPLGNFLADSYLAMAKRKYDPETAVAFINHGGIRVNAIQAGPLRRRTIYEVMPFDNQLVILKITGVQLQQYLDHLAAEGGGGVAGVQFVIRDKKATAVLVQGRPLDPSALYTMANSDYTISGGGGYQGLKNHPANKTGYLLRDATIDYCLQFGKEGSPIFGSTEKRITHAQ